MIHITAIQNSHELPQALYESLLGFVSDARKQRAKKFIRREDACRSIVGEVLAQYSVGKTARVPAKTVTFCVDSFGKPHADLDDQIHFSISHSKSWVVCTVDSGPVGIDVEYVRDYDPEVAKRFYHPHEYAALIALPEPEETEGFSTCGRSRKAISRRLEKDFHCRLTALKFCLKMAG